MADLPDELINRASVILEGFENNDSQEVQKEEAPSLEPEEAESAQLSFFAEENSKEHKPAKLTNKDNAALEELKSLNILEMNPLEAMNELYRLQKKLK